MFAPKQDSDNPIRDRKISLENNMNVCEMKCKNGFSFLSLSLFSQFFPPGLFNMDEINVD